MQGSGVHRLLGKKPQLSNEKRTSLQLMKKKRKNRRGNQKGSQEESTRLIRGENVEECNDYSNNQIRHPTQTWPGLQQIEKRNRKTVVPGGPERRCNELQKKITR